MNYPEEGRPCVCEVCGKSTDGIGYCTCPEGSNDPSGGRSLPDEK